MPAWRQEQNWYLSEWGFEFPGNVPWNAPTPTKRAPTWPQVPGSRSRAVHFKRRNDCLTKHNSWAAAAGGCSSGHSVRSREKVAMGGGGGGKRKECFKPLVGEVFWGWSWRDPKSALERESLEAEEPHWPECLSFFLNKHILKKRKD